MLLFSRRFFIFLIVLLSKARRTTFTKRNWSREPG